MPANQDKDEPVGSIKRFLGPYVYIGVMFALPYLVTGVLAAAFVAYVYPKAFAMVATILVLLFVVILWKVVRTKRRIEHRLIVRRADKQNTAYLQGTARVEEVMSKKPGKYRREDLDRLFGVDRGVHGKYRPRDVD